MSSSAAAEGKACVICPRVAPCARWTCRRPPPDLAGDPPRLIAKEEQRGCGDVVGLPDLAEWVTVPARLQTLVARKKPRREGVLVSDGATALTRITGAHSAASDRVSPSTAPLAIAIDA